MSTQATVSESPLSAIDELLGITSKSFDPFNKPTLTDKDETTLQTIIAQGGQTTDTSKPTPAATPGERELPDFMQPFKDVIAKPLDKPAEVDYSAEARAKFGPEYAHLNTRDAFTEELVLRTEKQRLIDEHPHYKALAEVEAGTIDKAKVIRDTIRAVEAKRANDNFEDFDEAQYQAKLAKFFENGQLNAAGLQRYEEQKAGYLQHLSNIRQDVEIKAKQALDEYRTSNAALQTEVKRFNIAGVPLDEDMQIHALEFIRSEKLSEWLNNDKLTPAEHAERELKMALIADPALFMKWLDKFGERSENFGMNKKASKIFN